MSDGTTLTPIDVGELTFNDEATVVWVRVRDAANLLWKDNPKRHDIGSIIESVGRYGFQERPKFDGNLPNVAGGIGAIVAGNGRVEALAAMERDERYELSRGLAADGSGAWCMPLLVGTDATSAAMAAAYAIDHNNIAFFGGDFTAYESMRLWGENYFETLTWLEEEDVLPVSVDGDDMDLFLMLDEKEEEQDEPEKDGESASEDVKWQQCPKCGHRWKK